MFSEKTLICAEVLSNGVKMEVHQAPGFTTNTEVAVLMNGNLVESFHVTNKTKSIQIIPTVKKVVKIEKDPSEIVDSINEAVGEENLSID